MTAQPGVRSPGAGGRRETEAGGGSSGGLPPSQGQAGFAGKGLRWVRPALGCGGSLFCPKSLGVNAGASEVHLRASLHSGAGAQPGCPGGLSSGPQSQRTGHRARKGFSAGGAPRLPTGSPPGRSAWPRVPGPGQRSGSGTRPRTRPTCWPSALGLFAPICLCLIISEDPFVPCENHFTLGRCLPSLPRTSDRRWALSPVLQSLFSLLSAKEKVLSIDLRDISLSLQLLMHSLADACVSPGWGSNPQPWGSGGSAPTQRAPPPAPAGAPSAELSLHTDRPCLCVVHTRPLPPSPTAPSSVLAFSLSRVTGFPFPQLLLLHPLPPLFRSLFSGSLF